MVIQWKCCWSFEMIAKAGVWSCKIIKRLAGRSPQKQCGTLVVAEARRKKQSLRSLTRQKTNRTLFA